MTDKHDKYKEHTPGPWSAVQRHEVAAQSGDSICMVLMRPTVGYGEANARLIADAPDLLAENRELLDLLTLALPYVEEAEWDKTHKPGAVEKLTKRIRAAVEDRP